MPVPVPASLRVPAGNMGGRLPQVALAVALGVVSGLYIYRPLFQPPGAQQPPEQPPTDAAPGKKP